jgi:hypothetical protein
LLAIAALAGAMTIARVDETEVATGPDASVEDVGVSAMRAYLDPETGEIGAGVGPVASKTLDPETQNALRRDTEGLVEVRHPDGRVSVNLQGRFQNAAVARVDENGVVTICSEHVHDVERALAGDEADSGETAEVE